MWFDPPRGGGGSERALGWRRDTTGSAPSLAADKTPLYFPVGGSAGLALLTSLGFLFLFPKIFSPAASCSLPFPAPNSLGPLKFPGAASQKPSPLRARRRLPQPGAFLEPPADPHESAWERVSAEQPQAQTDPWLDQAHQHAGRHRGYPPAHAEGQEVSEPLRALPARSIWRGASRNRALELPPSLSVRAEGETATSSSDRRSLSCRGSV